MPVLCLCDMNACGSWRRDRHVQPKRPGVLKECTPPTLCTNVNFTQVRGDVRNERDERDAQPHFKKYMNALKRANDCTDVDPCDTVRNDTCLDCTAATTATTAITVTTSGSVDIPIP